jgi:hypothetical protein
MISCAADCDANKVGGVWCFELDTFEGNQHAMQVTAHHCDGAAGEHNPSCDRAGRMRNTELLSLERKLTNPLCPRSECVVDTRMPFRVTQTFVTDTNGTLVTIENSVSQRGASFTFATGHGDGGYLASMTAAMRQGMVLAFQLWGGPWSTMFWLDAWTTRPALCSPGTACPESSRVVYRDVVIASL